MILAALILATDLAAVRWVVKARSYLDAGVGGGPMTAIRSYHAKYDGSKVLLVSNRLTGVTITTVVRPPTRLGLCRVWWPAVASGLLTLLTLVIPLTRTGRWFVQAIPIPRMTTRRWLIAIAVMGTEGGLIIGTLRDTGVDPLYARWTPILLWLIVLHTLAFMPVGIALLYRYARDRRFQNEPESLSDRRQETGFKTPWKGGPLDS
jgi:hypothetical protein